MAYTDKKTCISCRECKAITDFKVRRNKGRNDYVSGSCRDCDAEYHRSRLATKRQSPAWRHNKWITNLKSKYSMSKERYIDMLLEQDMKCPLCDKPQRTFVVDHDHACCDREGSCGRCVRGLLCHGCNKMLGHARDDVNTLKRATKYLEVACGSKS